MHILVSNDDGIYAPGICALAEAMRELGDVTVIAPEENHSATGHKKTLNRPLRVRTVRDYEAGVPAYAVDGSPSDCVAVAVLGFIKEPIDLVVAGINQGGNLAQDVTYSGTVSVALEAAIFGLPAIAFSLDNYSPEADYSQGKEVAVTVARAMLESPLPQRSILNVNIPYVPIQGYQVTRQGMRQYNDVLDERVDPRGRPYYWIGGPVPGGDVQQVGTDIWAVHNGYVSLTPIHLDLTAHSLLEQIRTWNIHAGA